MTRDLGNRNIYFYAIANGQILAFWSFRTSNSLEDFEGLDCFSNCSNQKTILSYMTNAERGIVKLNLQISHGNLLPITSLT